MKPATALRRLAPTTRVLKRAQYECFEFTVGPDGVLVRNTTYLDPENHEYTVAVENGVPTSCTCPADERFDGPCKHRVAVAIRAPILAAATEVTLAADGGLQSEPVDSLVDMDSVDEAEPDEDCDCARLDGFPCWSCVDAGRRTLPSE